MSCMLRALGVEFAVDDFIAGSSLFLCAHRLYRKGEPMFPVTQPNGPMDEHSGINIKVSAAKRNQLEEQIEDAIAYLEKNQEELKRLCNFPGVEVVGLDFGVELPDEFESMYFTPKLLYLAGNIGIGIEITYY